jgi:hypothetical protein
MNILEYEDLLNPKKEEQLLKEEIWPRPGDVGVRGNGSGAVIRTGMTVGTNESFMSNRSTSAIWRAEDLTAEDRLDVMNAVINFINNEARGQRYERSYMEHLSRRIQSYVEAYFYRWYPCIRRPNILCNIMTLTHTHQMSTDFIITINHVHLGTMGVGVY